MQPQISKGTLTWLAHIANAPNSGMIASDVCHAQELIERWSRPIFEQYRERREDEDLRERELQMRQARAARQKAQAAAHDEEEAQKRVLFISFPFLTWILGVNNT